MINCDLTHPQSVSDRHGVFGDYIETDQDPPSAEVTGLVHCGGSVYICLRLLFLHLVKNPAIGEMFLLRGRPTAEGLIDRNQLQLWKLF